MGKTGKAGKAGASAQAGAFLMQKLEVGDFLAKGKECKSRNCP
jgi:hypothetical protein